MAKRILDALHELSRELGIPLITPEYEILLTLLHAGSLATEELCDRSPLSRAGFFHALDRLKHWQFVTCDPDPTDRRRKAYRLHPRTANMLMENILDYRATPERVMYIGLTQDDGAAADEPRCAPPAERRLPSLSCEYQILLHLFFFPGATTGEIRAGISSSPSKLHSAMRMLAARELIQREETTGDRRRKCYVIPDWLRRAIARTHACALSWADDVTRLAGPASQAQSGSTATRRGQ